MIMLLIRYENRIAAIATPEQVLLAPHVRVLEADHPLRRWVFCLGVFAGEVIHQRLRGPYDDERAGVFARNALLPDEEFCPLVELCDAELAELFNVPLREISEKRRDLHELAIF